MGLYDDAQVIKVGGRKIDPEHTAFVTALIALPDGQGMTVNLPAAVLTVTERELNRAARELNAGIKIEYDKDNAGIAVVDQHGKVAVACKAWIRKAREPRTDAPVTTRTVAPVKSTQAAPKRS